MSSSAPPSSPSFSSVANSSQRINKFAREPEHDRRSFTVSSFASSSNDSTHNFTTTAASPFTFAFGNGNGNTNANNGSDNPDNNDNAITNYTAVSDERKQEEARAAILATLESAGSGYYDAQYQRRAIDLHANAAALEKQEKQVRASANALSKESAKWSKEVTRMTKGLNEFGDLENWAEMLDNDLLVLEETLRLVERRSERTEANEVRPWHADDYEIN